MHGALLKAPATSASRLLAGYGLPGPLSTDLSVDSDEFWVGLGRPSIRSMDPRPSRKELADAYSAPSETMETVQFGVTLGSMSGMLHGVSLLGSR